MKPVVVAPLVALALAAGGVGAYFWLSSGGGEEEVVAQPTPTPAATTATAVPSLTAIVAPSPTPTPLPGGKAPEGCLASEKAYVDPDGRFAFCYPSRMELSTAETKAGTPATTVADPTEETDNAVTANFGLIAEPYEVCGGALDISPTVIKNERVVDFTIAGMKVEACFRDHYYPAEPDVLWYKALDLMALTGDGRPVIIFATYSGPDFATSEAKAMRILDSAVLY